MKKFITILVIVIIVILIFVAFKGKDDYESIVTEDNAVLILDQQPSDDSVVVSYAKLSQPGYVLVSEVDSATNEPVVVGASELLSAGEHIGVTVLRRDSKNHASDTTVTATIVADNGDGVYDEATDTEILTKSNPEGTVEVEVFSEAMVSEDAEELVELSLEELAELLEEAGYNVNEQAMIEEYDDSTMMDDDSSMIEEDGSGSGDQNTEESNN
jgi:hypothetical protein